MINLFKFIIGTVLGSFITLTSIRTDHQESIVFPPSHCDYCGHRLQPWELIPIISFLILRGKCHQCHHPVGLLTLFGEILGGVITLINPLSTMGLIETIFDLLLLFIAECDFRSYLIPTWSLSTLAIITSLLDILNQALNLKLLVVILTIYLVTVTLNAHLKWLGNGDVDLIFIMLLKTGFHATILIILISSILAIIKYTVHHQSLYIPYAPYLAIGYALITFI